MSERSRSIVEFYVVANRLKETIRSGPRAWGISAERLESVAEHVFGAQMLAIAVVSEYEMEVDLMKVVKMLAAHELAEAVIGDITPGCGVPSDVKYEMEIEAVDAIVGRLMIGEELRGLFVEFEENETAEARFCNQIDKLEAAMQVKIWDEMGLCDFETPRTGFLEERRQESVEKGWGSLSEYWIGRGIEDGTYEGAFLELAEYVRGNDISEARRGMIVEDRRGEREKFERGYEE